MQKKILISVRRQPTVDNFGKSDNTGRSVGKRNIFSHFCIVRKESSIYKPNLLLSVCYHT